MSYRFVNKLNVIFDIEEIVAYYKSVNPELASSFLDRIEETKKYIVSFPDCFLADSSHKYKFMLFICIFF